MLNALTTIIYQSHFMQVFNIFVSQLLFNHLILHRYNFHALSRLSRCFPRIAAVRTVARSNGVRPQLIEHYFYIFSSFKVAWVIHARYVLLKHRSPPCSKMDEGQHRRLPMTLTAFNKVTPKYSYLQDSHMQQRLEKKSN